MTLDVLKELIEKMAYFLSRVNPKAKVFEKQGDQYVEFNFVKIKRYMEKGSIDSLEKDVYIGSLHKLPVRMILHLVSEGEMARRIREARKFNRKNRLGAVTAEYKARAAFDLFITNAEQEMLPAGLLRRCYRLRWQIELIFKIWKSICQIDKVKKVKKERFECYVYAKLIFILLAWQIVWTIAKYLFHHEGVALSFFKAFRTLATQFFEDVRDVFVWGKESPKIFMFRFYSLSKNYHVLEKKKNKLTLLENLLVVTKR